MGIWRRINRFLPWFFILGIPAVMLLIFLVLKLYGKEYPVDFILLALFAGGTTILCLNNFYGWLIAALGHHGMRIWASIITISALLNVALNMLFIPLIGLKGAILATVITYCLSTLLLITKKSILVEEIPF
jgi:O-antigen/teichoic acid export membrane protein